MSEKKQARTILRPEEAIRIAGQIGKNNKDISIRSNFIISKLEGKDKYTRGLVDVDQLVESLQSIISLYPEFEPQLNQIISDCNDKYTFKSGIKNIEEFMNELEKFYIHNEKLAKLLIDKNNPSESYDESNGNIYIQLYKIYRTYGASRIQSMINRLQRVDIYELIEAEEGWRFKEQVIDAHPIPCNNIDIPSCDELFKE